MEGPAPGRPSPVPRPFPPTQVSPAPHLQASGLKSQVSPRSCPGRAAAPPSPQPLGAWGLCLRSPSLATSWRSLVSSVNEDFADHLLRCSIETGVQPDTC